MAVLIYDPTGQLEFGALVAEGESERVPLCGRSLVIGRSAKECDIAIMDEPAVAEQHCRISRAGGRVLLETLPAGADTQVNDATVTTAELNDQDIIQIGGVRYRFELPLRSSPASTSAPEPAAPPTEAPPPDGDEWYAEIGGSYQGPFSVDQLRDKVQQQALTSTDYVKLGPTGTPQPAGRVSSLKSLFVPGTASPQPEPSSATPDAVKQWYVEVGGRNHGPLNTDEIRDWIDSGRLDASDYARSGEHGTPQPAGRTAELKPLFAAKAAAARGEAAATPAEPPPASKSQPRSTSAQSADLQAMVDSLPESVEPLPQAPSESAAPPEAPKKKRRRRKGSQQADVDAMLDEVLFSDEPPPPKATSAPASVSGGETSDETPTKPEQGDPEPVPSSAASAALQSALTGSGPPASSAPSMPSPPTPSPPRPAAKPPKFKPPKKKKEKVKREPNSQLEALAKPLAIAGLLVVLYFGWNALPTSYESHRPQLEKLQEIGKEMDSLMQNEGSAEAWQNFISRANPIAEAVAKEYSAGELDVAGEELRSAAKLFPDAAADAITGKKTKAILFNQYLNRVAFLLGDVDMQ